MNKLIRNALFIVTALALSAPTSAADSIKPLSAKLLDLGEYQAVVYYENTLNGWEVTTTLRSLRGGDGVRYVSMLAPGETQSLLIDTASPIRIQLGHTTRGLSVDVVEAQNLKP
ncbi:MAG: hypothetical protein OES09_13960 [Gammaproteobacteria bacterium]|nr:hypothetical protein [Gammaproteobacteria bacterium]